jgi:hypothetical protein
VTFCAFAPVLDRWRKAPFEIVERSKPMKAKQTNSIVGRTEDTKLTLLRDTGKKLKIKTGITAGAKHKDQ